MPSPALQKSRSPFFPGQPVPKEMFVGRAAEISSILARGVGQVAAGKPVTMFVRGEYGIGKSSIANFVQYMAETNHQIHGIYAPLSAATNLSDMVTAIVAATVSSGTAVPDRALKMRAFLSKYVGEQRLLGVSINFAALAPDVPKLSNPFSMIEFLRDSYEQLRPSGVKGIFLILDEIDGLASQAFFGQFLKGIVDKNALSDNPLPLLILVCGTDQHLQQMAVEYEPIARVFSPVIDIDALGDADVATFFRDAFASVGMTVTDEAMAVMTEQSGGLPRFLHLVGDAAYWGDADNMVSLEDAVDASLRAAEEIGKYVNHQVYEALRSRDYKSILLKIGGEHPTKMTFRRRDVAAGLSEQERGKLDNFLQRMQRMSVIGKGEEQGEYVFKTRLVRLYIWLQARKNKAEGAAAPESDTESQADVPEIHERSGETAPGG